MQIKVDGKGKIMKDEDDGSGAFQVTCIDNEVPFSVILGVYRPIKTAVIAFCLADYLWHYMHSLFKDLSNSTSCINFYVVLEKFASR